MAVQQAQSKRSWLKRHWGKVSIAACVPAATLIYTIWKDMTHISIEYRIMNESMTDIPTSGHVTKPIVSDINFTTQITYYNNGSRPFTIDYVKLYFIPNRQDQKCTDSSGGVPAGSPLIASLKNSDSVGTEVEPETINAGEYPVRTYEYLIFSNPMMPNPAQGLLCFSFSITDANFQTKTVQIPTLIRVSKDVPPSGIGIFHPFFEKGSHAL